MKKQIVILSSLLIAVALMFGVISCKKSSTTTTFGLSSLKAGAVDMNGATPPSNVSNTPTIVAGFSVDVNASTVTQARITLVRDYDQASIALTITVSGSNITIVPQVDLGNGALYKLSFLGGIQSSDGQVLPAFNRAFTTVGTFVPSGMIAYWNFENNANDQVGSYSPTAAGIIDLTYVDSYSTAAGKAASFNGTTTLIEIPNGDVLENTNDFTIAFWVKPDSTKHGQFVMGLAGWYGFQFEIASDYTWCKLAAQYRTDTSSASQDLWFPGDGQTKDNGGWKGWTFCRDLRLLGGVQGLLANKWAYVVCRFTAATKIATMYINGDKEKEQDYNLYDPPMTEAQGLKYHGNAGNNSFVFGFIQDKVDPTITDSWADYTNPANSHFKGLLDNVRVFHKSLTEQEIQLMYASEKP